MLINTHFLHKYDPTLYFWHFKLYLPISLLGADVQSAQEFSDYTKAKI